MYVLSPNSFDVTQVKTPTPTERTKSVIFLIRKFLGYLGLSAIFISLGLILGVIGYHWAAGLSWLDALVEASMILSGMGPISPLSTIGAKVFASIYALFSGLIFVQNVIEFHGNIHRNRCSVENRVVDVDVSGTTRPPNCPSPVT